MNNILQKCITELQKENFRKDYVLGLLEAVVGLDMPPNAPKLPVEATVIPIPNDEARALDMAAKAKLASIQQMTKYE